jgi:signal transduction histidine kinase
MVTGRPSHAAAFIQDHLCFFRWASAAAILLWVVTLVAHLSYALPSFHAAALGLGLAPEAAAPALAGGSILIGISGASYFLIFARGQLSIPVTQRTVLLSAVGIMACEGLQVGLTHGRAEHLPSYILCNLILFSISPLKASQQIGLAVYSLALPVIVAFATGYPVDEFWKLSAIMTLPLAAVVLGLIAFYWQHGSFMRRRLAELRLARRNAQVERQKRELERRRRIEQGRIKWLEQMARFLRHELRNAMVGATTSLTLLQRRAGISGDDAYLARTRQALRVIGALLDSVSNATSIESTLMKETRMAVRLQRVVQEQGEVYRSIYPDKVFTVETDGEDVVVLGRSERFIEMLDNLVENAIDHADPGTSIEVGCLRQKDRAVLRVANQGPPLPDSDSIFDLFASYRDHTQRGEHMGLGLYMVKLIATRYGGHVEARGRTGTSGAEFRVVLPIAS